METDDQEWCCLNCARRYRPDSDNHNGEGELSIESTVPLDVTRNNSPLTTQQRKHIRKHIKKSSEAQKAILHLLETEGKMPKQAIITTLQSQGLSISTLDRELRQLKQTGEIIRERRGYTQASRRKARSPATTQKPVTADGNAITTGDKAITTLENSQRAVVSTDRNPQRRPRARFLPQPLYMQSTNGAWFAPHEISFRPKHMLFLIVHLNLLREGGYPPDPTVTGYTDMPIPRKGKRGSKRAYFIMPVEFAAEVDARLELAGLDGLRLEFLYVDDPVDKQWRMRHLANMLKIDLRTMERRIDTVLKFISGRRRKTQDYKRYRKYRKYSMKS